MFIDFKKAFDMVSRDMLWKVLEILGCPRKFVIIVKGKFGKLPATLGASNTGLTSLQVYVCYIITTEFRARN